jgi:hypothetical protein
MRNLKKCVTGFFSREIPVSQKMEDSNQNFLNDVTPLLSFISESLGNLLIFAAFGGIALCAGLEIVKPESGLAFYKFFGWIAFLSSLFVLAVYMTAKFAEISQKVKRRTVAKAIFAVTFFCICVHMYFVIYSTIIWLQIRAVS